MATSTYEPGIGITSEMDHNGRVKYWEYDNKGRVARILNNDREPITEYEYNVVNINN